MIDYSEVQSMTDQGIAEFSNGGSFDIITTGAGKKIVNGKEVVVAEIREKVYGAVKAISMKYIDGENVKHGDKRAFFSNVTKIEIGMIIIINNQHWRVVDNRPVNPTESHVIAYRPILRKVSTYG